MSALSNTQAVPLQGCVRLAAGDWVVSSNLFNATSNCKKSAWGVAKVPRAGFEIDPMGEPYLNVQVYNQQSFDNCRAFHCHPFGESLGWEGSWSDNYPEVQGFPRCFPLRFFIKNNGDFKNDGDTLKLIFRGKPILLTCMFKPEHLGDNQLIDSFADGIAKRIECSIRFKMLSTEEVDQAKAMAEAHIAEYFDPNDPVEAEAESFSNMVEAKSFCQENPLFK